MSQPQTVAGYTGQVTAPGEAVNAFVTFKIAPENMQEVLLRLNELKHNPPEGIAINKIVPVAGRIDCVLDVTAASPDDHFIFVTEDLGKIRGINSIESLVGNESWLNYIARAPVTPGVTAPGMAPAAAWRAPQAPVGSRAARYRQGYR